jgi:hypothetical protein
MKVKGDVNMVDEYFKVEWRTNDSPCTYDCMLCHNYSTNSVFVIPRCCVCSKFYVPSSLSYVRNFIKCNGYNVELPGKITEIVYIGECSQKLAMKIEHTMTYLTFNYRNQYKVNINGYEKFKEFISKLGGDKSVFNY